MDDTTNRDDSFIAFEDQDIDEKVDNNTTGKKVWRFFKKFFLAVIAIALIVVLVFQIIFMCNRPVEAVPNDPLKIPQWLANQAE